MNNQSTIVSNEFCVSRFSNGIKLLAPHHSHYRESNSLRNLLRLPFPVYLEKPDHLSVRSNEPTAIACGFESLNDFVGKFPFANFTKDTVHEKIANHEKVMHNNLFLITEETAKLDNDDRLNTLAIRMPWYNDENKIIGLFGCSIVLGKNPLAQSLDTITKLNLLNNQDCLGMKKNIGSEFDNIYFSKRELECLLLTIKGKPAKQVAYELNISQRTVEEHLDNIKRKAKVKSKSALIEKAIEYFFSKNK